jgi:hypothetical protein
MKPRKYAENRLMVLRVDPDAIVDHCKEPFSISSLSRDMNTRRRLSAVLNRITDQILEKLHETRIVAVDGGQTAAGPNGPALLDCPVEILLYLLKNRVEIDGFIRFPRSAPSSV